MSVVFGKRAKNLAYDLQVRQFALRSDVEANLGGDDTGPTPHELLEASLAACTAITLQMYAGRKGIPLQDVQVKVQILNEGSENRMGCEVQLIGDLTLEQRQGLMAIAEKCPIHKFLGRGAVIDTRSV